MIRIDEIYDSIFSKIILSKPNQSMHYFDPFGRTDIDALRVQPLIAHRDRAFIFWDQEPYFPYIHYSTIDYFTRMFSMVDFESVNIPWLSRGMHPSVHDIPHGVYTKIPKLKISDVTFVTSEKNSKNIKKLIHEFGFDVAYYFFHGWASIDWFRGYNRTNFIPNFKERNITNTFICPNRIVSGKREHRIKLFKNLVNHNLVNNNKISFPSVCPYSKEKIVIDGVSLPLLFDNEDENNIPNESYKISLWEQAKESLLYVVTETVYEEETLHLTEKVFKPIVMQMPFVLVGGRYNLEYLRSYGFKTFGDFWDESYDNQPNNKRLDSITQLLKDLNDMSLREKAQLQKHITPLVEHNFNWFYSNEFENLLWKELTNMTASWN